MEAVVTHSPETEVDYHSINKDQQLWFKFRLVILKWLLKLGPFSSLCIYYLTNDFFISSLEASKCENVLVASVDKFQCREQTVNIDVVSC